MFECDHVFKYPSNHVGVDNPRSSYIHVPLLPRGRLGVGGIICRVWSSNLLNRL